MKVCRAVRKFPWTLLSGVGADTVLITMVAANLGHTVKIIQVPWKWGLHSMEINEIDGCYAASFKTDRMTQGV